MATVLNLVCMWLAEEKRVEAGLHLAGALAVAGLGALVGAGAVACSSSAILWALVAYLARALADPTHRETHAGAEQPQRRAGRVFRMALATAFQTLLCAFFLGPSAAPAVLCFSLSFCAVIPAPTYDLVRGELRLVIVERQGKAVRRIEGVVSNGKPGDGRHRLAALAEIVRQRAVRQPTAVIALRGAAAHSGWIGPGAEVLDPVSFLERVEGRVPVEMLTADWPLDPGGFRLTRSRFVRFIKRSVDIAVSVVGLLVGLPVLLLGGFMVRLSSAGPVFFRQERTGKNGGTFTIRKLRTMVVHDPTKHSRYASEQDPRLTWAGAFLRRTHLDELPQLANVLAGQMSLVGPRAEWSVLAEEYARVIPHYSLRHLVRPGLTGWAQVCFPYGRSVEDAREKLRYDLYYIKRHTLFLDLVIMVRTLRLLLGLP